MADESTHLKFRRWRATVLIGIVCNAGLASPMASQEPALIVPGGQTEFSQGFGLYSEAFQMPLDLAAALATSHVGAVVRLAAFPVAPGVREPVELAGIDLYAPGARTLVIEGRGEREQARSPRRYFLGWASSEPATRVGVAFDPVTGHLRGIVDGPRGRFQLTEPAANDPERHRLTSVEALVAAAGGLREPSCGTAEMPLPDSLVDRLIRVPGPTTVDLAGGPTHSAAIAVDTDMELLDEKFGNDTTAAADWIADLFLEMNVAYERDVGLRLLVGDTFLRPGSPPYDGDPWDVEGSGASSAQLNEFGSFWSANMGGVDRVFALLLSGKSSSGNSASGIAWIDGYCEFQNTGGGYSVNQVFTSGFSSATLVAHEIGHNAGSPHTHCYSPEVDQCYNAESGCYGGAVSCPGGPGTVMSYCNFSPPNGAGCGQNQLEFHPTVVALFDTFIAAHPSCVETILDDLVFADGFESGDTANWSADQ